MVTTPLALDRVLETTTTTGTGTYTLAGASTGYRSFSVVGNGKQCFYTVTDGTNWEVGLGTYTSAGTTLARTKILASSNSGNAVNWGAGTKQVYLNHPAVQSQNILYARQRPQGRLTLSSTDPVGGGSATTTLYYLPYGGNYVELYDVDGGYWKGYQLPSSGINSGSLAGLTASVPYDVFLYDSSGTLTLDETAWTSATARATALTTQDGVYVKTGNPERLYLGTVYSNGSSQFTDTTSTRGVWNYYNRVGKPIYCKPTDSSHTYTTATWRGWNAGTTVGQQRFELVQGVAEEVADFLAYAVQFNSTEPGAFCGIGVDSTSVNSADVFGGWRVQTTARYCQVPAIGYHYYQLLQYSTASGTTTWYGDNHSGAVAMQSGITGVWCC